MLFGPIVGIAMALAEANLHLLLRSLVSEIAGAACVLAVGFVIGISTRDLSIGSEILSRTSPSLLDLLIGLVGGLAGGFTFVSTGLGGVVVGVAISTALVPPLTTCGILWLANCRARQPALSCWSSLTSRPSPLALLSASGSRDIARPLPSESSKHSCHDCYFWPCSSSSLFT